MSVPHPPTASFGVVYVYQPILNDTDVEIMNYHHSCYCDHSHHSWQRRRFRVEVSLTPTDETTLHDVISV